MTSGARQPGPVRTVYCREKRLMVSSRGCQRALGATARTGGVEGDLQGCVLMHFIKLGIVSEQADVPVASITAAPHRSPVARR